MKTIQHFSIGVIALVALTAVVAGQSPALMVSGSGFGGRGIVLFDPHDGQPLTGNYYFEVLEASAVLKHPLQVGDEIWISAQSGATGNRILRYDLTGNFLGDITAAGPSGETIANVRGMGIVNGEVWLTNSAGDPGPAMVVYDTDGNWLATHPAHSTTSSPFSVLHYNDEVLIGSSAADDIHRYDTNGNYLGPFHVGTIAFVQQLFERSNGNVLAAGFSSPAGTYEYDPFGIEVGYISGSGNRGVWELGNGNILWTNSSGVHVYDITTQSSTQVFSGLNSQYVGLLTLDEPVPCPGDLTGDGNVGVGDLLFLLSCWGPIGSGCEVADLTGDDNVGVADLLILLGNWGPCP